MTGANENRSTQPKDRPAAHGPNARQSLARVLPLTLLVVIIMAVVLLPGILSEDSELPQITTIDVAPIADIPAALPEPVQAFSTGALEDLRASPLENLTIDPQPLLLELLPDDTEVATAPDEPTQAEPAPDMQEETAPLAPEAPFSVGEALARYLLVIREQLNSEYVANCIRYRNRNGAGADCPTDPAIAVASSYQEEKALVDELFAIITREGEYARISSRLAQENETLNSILSAPDNPVAALQASTKLALNNAYLNYLNGNPNPDVVRLNTMNNFVNDYNRTIMAGPTQFQCQGGPCDYEFTGIGEK